MSPSMSFFKLGQIVPPGKRLKFVNNKQAPSSTQPSSQKFPNAHVTVSSGLPRNTNNEIAKLNFFSKKKNHIFGSFLKCKTNIISVRIIYMHKYMYAKPRAQVVLHSIMHFALAKFSAAVFSVFVCERLSNCNKKENWMLGKKKYFVTSDHWNCC